MAQHAPRPAEDGPGSGARFVVPVAVLATILLFCLTAIPRIAPLQRGSDFLEPGPSADTDRPPGAPLQAATEPVAPPARRTAARAVDEPPAPPDEARAAGTPASKPERPHSCEGRIELTVVTPDGRPAGGATVELRAAGTSSLHLADPLGRATLAAGGEIVLVAWRENAASEPFELSVPPGATRSAELSLRPATPVSGRVTDAETGAPVAGAEVRFWTHAELDVVRTDADGVFHHPRFPAGEAAHQVRVEHPDFGPAVRYLACGPAGWTLFSPRDFEEEAGGAGTPWLELSLAPALRVSGRVADEGLRPLPGARVRVEGYVRVLDAVATPDAAETAAGEAGDFALTGLRADVSHALVVTAPGRARQVIEIPAGTRRFDAGVLVLEPERTLAGIVADADGVPVAGLEVELVRLDDAAPEPRTTNALDAGARFAGRRLSLTTDEHGAFQARGLGAERLSLRLLRAGRVLAEEEIDLRPCTEVARTFRLSPELATLIGVVQDGEGTAAGAEVVVSYRGAPVARVAADAQGRFRVAGLSEPGPYDLRASHRGADREALFAEGRAWSSEQARLILQPRKHAPRR